MDRALLDEPALPMPYAPWDYRATFAESNPSLASRLRQSINQSRTWLLGLNPLAMNPFHRPLTPASKLRGLQQPPSAPPSSSSSNSYSLFWLFSSRSSADDASSRGGGSGGSAGGRSVSPEMSQCDNDGGPSSLPAVHVKTVAHTTTVIMREDTTFFPQRGYRGSDPGPGAAGGGGGRGLEPQTQSSQTDGAAGQRRVSWLLARDPGWPFASW